jgi:hypothetical protein
MSSCRSLFALAASLVAASTLSAQIAQWSSLSGGNDHYYELVVAPGGITWAAADTAAQNAGGYLATLTSVAENTFAFNLAAATPSAWFIDGPGNGLGPWLGGYQATFLSEPAGGWVWGTGESWSYTNWASGEPSNYNNIEDRLQLFGSQTLMAATWNDIPSGGNADGPAHAYLIEYNTNPVPEPSTYALIFGAGALVVGLRRKRPV